MKGKILGFYEASDIPLSPYSVAKGLNFNPATVRARISDLARLGYLERITRGLYQYVPRDGVGYPGKIQNFLATVQARPRLARDHLEGLAALGIIEKRGNQFFHVYKFTGPPAGPEGEVKQEIQFGVKRNKITWRIKAPLGLDYYGLMFAYGLAKCTLARIGQASDLPFNVINHEYLEDRIGLRIEGAQAITFTDFKGNLEKIYNKKYGLRRETRDTESRPIHELLALYQGGLPQFMVAQASYDIARQVSKNSDNIGRLAEQVYFSNKVNQAVLEAINRVIGKLDKE